MEDSYEEEVRRGIMKGMLRGMKRQGRLNPGEPDVVMAVEQDEQLQEVYDNLSGGRLDAKMVKEARKEEMAEVYKHGVYEKVSLAECYDKTCKQPIGTRWVDINKGDGASRV